MLNFLCLPCVHCKSLFSLSPFFPSAYHTPSLSHSCPSPKIHQKGLNEPFDEPGMRELWKVSNLFAACARTQRNELQYEVLEKSPTASEPPDSLGTLNVDL